ncbi:MAG: hypothetical protein GKR90_25200 [Pseudomonadales bacterium]|nr:hypothetical protein [Pseudomonadales bacterium]
MERIRGALAFLWPDLILEGSKWENDWVVSQRDRFAKSARVFFVLAAVGYFGHYFLIDIPNDKQPLELWFAFRMSATIACTLCFILFITKKQNTVWAKWVAAVVMAAGCHAQAHVVLYYPDAPWIYPFVFTLGAVLLLQYPPFKSLLFAAPLMGSFFPPLLEAGNPFDQLASATFLTSVIVLIARTAYTFELRAFLLTQERDESRQHIIELGRDYENRLKSFIPRVIADRMQHRIDKRGMSALEATVDVLTAKKQRVACLFSDIRGFTQGSNEMETFLLESAIPEVKACSDAVENFRGIPRKIGDLIFAYFDDSIEKANVLRSIGAGLELSKLNQDLNDTSSSVKVRRYILISTGDAIVGNVGGLNSGVEITALGPPVNFLSRLDDATKAPALADHLLEGDLVICVATAKLLEDYSVDLPLNHVEFASKGLKIRDFPEVESVYVLRPSDEVRNIVSSSLQAV